MAEALLSEYLGDAVLELVGSGLRTMLNTCG